MVLKRKPPAGNARRVAPVGNNLRYTIASKANETVQCESFQERKITLLFDRDPTVQEYRSQPERFAFTDSQETSSPIGEPMDLIREPMDLPVSPLIGEG